MTDTIKPTTGRVVLYTYGASQAPAFITGVNEDGTVNLHVFPNESRDCFFCPDVVQGDADGQWDWMPFQKDQQARMAAGTLNASHPAPSTDAQAAAPEASSAPEDTAPTGSPSDEQVEAVLATDWGDNKAGETILVTPAKKADLIAQGHVAAESEAAPVDETDGPEAEGNKESEQA